MSTVQNVYEAWQGVMQEVTAIAKSDRNTQQGFAFRGIDAVMSAVGPALRNHGVFIIPTGTDIKSETYETNRGTSMRNVTVTMGFKVFGPAGDSFTGVSFGEAADAGDKAVTKAQSVAYRTFLLQSLTVPTGDADPDAYTHERASSAPADPDFEKARGELAEKAKQFGYTREGMEDRCIETVGLPVTAKKIRDFIKQLEKNGVPA
jgi:hypothetical protein